MQYLAVPFIMQFATGSSAMVGLLPVRYPSLSYCRREAIIGDGLDPRSDQMEEIEPF